MASCRIRGQQSMDMMARDITPLKEPVLGASTDKLTASSDPCCGFGRAAGVPAGDRARPRLRGWPGPRRRGGLAGSEDPRISLRMISVRTARAAATPGIVYAPAENSGRVRTGLG